MGSVATQDAVSINDYVRQLQTGRTDENDFSVFEIISPPKDQEAIANVLGDGILLLSWFLTLLRTRDNPSLCFDWVHYIPRNGYIQDQGAECFKIGDLMTNMNHTVGITARKISSLLQSESAAQSVKATNCPLILSTSSQSSDYFDELVSPFLLRLPPGLQDANFTRQGCAARGSTILQQ